jgi:DNA-binding MarR family transcriptional regulator
MAASEKLNFECLAYASRRTSRAVTNLFNARMRPVDLNVAQFGLLAAIAKAPGQTLVWIADEMLLDESTMVRNFTVLEKRGLVDAEGGRGRGGKQVSLTPAGHKLHAAGSRIWADTNAELSRALGSKGATAARAALAGLSAAAEKLHSEDKGGLPPKAADERAAND